ncbi:MAG: hypothetical protein KAI24_13455, partial [Planctomycetes bacterium]|nr:hypothetical protein [Planctomycetota bacterium]
MDPSRLFSLVCLLNQCVLAWVFVGFFGALTRGSARWLRSFLAAFVGLGVGLTAIVLRFLLHELPGMSGPPVADGALAVRALYGVYLAGKLLFLAGLVRGVLRWRGKPAGAPAWVVGVTVVTGLVLGFAVPTIETVLLVQGPVAVVACAFAAWQLRADGRDGLPDAGRP